MEARTATELAPVVQVDLPSAATMHFEKCDQCRHRAYVMVMTKDGPLAFCSHHFDQHAAILGVTAAVIHDIRSELAPTNRTMH